ncbi:hypothetical protein GVX82_04620 [Patescibacteria group bacterium]|nr:hypothetical protein [Patescibacteria group bacterium]
MKEQAPGEAQYEAIITGCGSFEDLESALVGAGMMLETSDVRSLARQWRENPETARRRAREIEFDGTLKAKVLELVEQDPGGIESGAGADEALASARDEVQTIAGEYGMELPPEEQERIAQDMAGVPEGDLRAGSTAPAEPTDSAMPPGEPPVESMAAEVASEPAEGDPKRARREEELTRWAEQHPDAAAEIASASRVTDLWQVLNGDSFFAYLPGFGEALLVPDGDGGVAHAQHEAVKRVLDRASESTELTEDELAQVPGLAGVRLRELLAGQHESSVGSAAAPAEIAGAGAIGSAPTPEKEPEPVPPESLAARVAETGPDPYEEFSPLFEQVHTPQQLTALLRQFAHALPPSPQTTAVTKWADELDTLVRRREPLSQATTPPAGLPTAARNAFHRLAGAS